MESFAFVGNVYTCTGTIGNSQIIDEVTGISGNHLPDKNNTSVETLVLANQNLQYFLINIADAEYFPNLRRLDLSNNVISSIGNIHLAPHKYLEDLNFSGNKITTFDSDVLYGMSNMRYASFSYNDLQYVGHDVILPSVGVYFERNTCIDMYAFNSAENTRLRFHLLVQCPPLISQIERSLESRGNLLTRVNEDVQSLNIITDNLMEAVNTHTNLLQHVNDDLESQIRINIELETRIKQLEDVIEKLRVALN